MSGLRALAEDFVALFYEQRDPSAAFTKYVAEDYIQHNPKMQDGRENALKTLVPLFGGEGAHFSVKRILVDAPYFAVHLHGRPDPSVPGVAVADFYRVEDGKIVEHWDVIQPIEIDVANPRGMF